MTRLNGWPIRHLERSVHSRRHPGFDEGLSSNQLEETRNALVLERRNTRSQTTAIVARSSQSSQLPPRSCADYTLLTGIIRMTYCKMRDCEPQASSPPKVGLACTPFLDGVFE